eukprot:7901227-Pyramimonas_sp.AAC.1
MAKHGQRDVWTRIGTTNVCPFCLTTFSCVKTAQRHLLSSVARGGHCLDRSRYIGERHHPDR